MRRRMDDGPDKVQSISSYVTEGSPWRAGMKTIFSVFTQLSMKLKSSSACYCCSIITSGTPSIPVSRRRRRLQGAIELILQTDCKTCHGQFGVHGSLKLLLVFSSVFQSQQWNQGQFCHKVINSLNQKNSYPTRVNRPCSPQNRHREPSKAMQIPNPKSKFLDSKFEIKHYPNL